MPDIPVSSVSSGSSAATPSAGGGAPAASPSAPADTTPTIPLRENERLDISGLTAGEKISTTLGEMAEAVRFRKQMEAAHGGPLTADVLQQAKLYKDTVSGSDPQAFRKLVNSLLPDVPATPPAPTDPRDVEIRSLRDALKQLETTVSEQLLPPRGEIREEAQRVQVKGWIEAEKAKYPTLAKQSAKSAIVVAQQFKALQTQAEGEASRRGYSPEQARVFVRSPEVQGRLIERAAQMTETQLQDVLSSYGITPQGGQNGRVMVNDQRVKTPVTSTGARYVFDPVSGQYVDTTRQVPVATNGNGTVIPAVPTSPVPTGMGPSGASGEVRGPMSEADFRASMRRQGQALRTAVV